MDSATDLTPPKKIRKLDPDDAVTDDLCDKHNPPLGDGQTKGSQVNESESKAFEKKSKNIASDSSPLPKKIQKIQSGDDQLKPLDSNESKRNVDTDEEASSGEMSTNALMTHKRHRNPDDGDKTNETVTSPPKKAQKIDSLSSSDDPKIPKVDTSDNRNESSIEETTGSVARTKVGNSDISETVPAESTSENRQMVPDQSSVDSIASPSSKVQNSTCQNGPSNEEGVFENKDVCSSGSVCEEKISAENVEEKSQFKKESSSHKSTKNCQEESDNEQKPINVENVLDDRTTVASKESVQNKNDESSMERPKTSTEKDTNAVQNKQPSVSGTEGESPCVMQDNINDPTADEQKDVDDSIKNSTCVVKEPVIAEDMEKPGDAKEKEENIRDLKFIKSSCGHSDDKAECQNSVTEESNETVSNKETKLKTGSHDKSGDVISQSSLHNKGEELSDLDQHKPLQSEEVGKDNETVKNTELSDLTRVEIKPDSDVRETEGDDHIRNGDWLETEDKKNVALDNSKLQNAVEEKAVGGGIDNKMNPSEPENESLSKDKRNETDDKYDKVANNMSVDRKNECTEPNDAVKDNVECPKASKVIPENNTNSAGNGDSEQQSENRPKQTESRLSENGQGDSDTANAELDITDKEGGAVLENRDCQVSTNENNSVSKNEETKNRVDCVPEESASEEMSQTDQKPVDASECEDSLITKKAKLTDSEIDKTLGDNIHPGFEQGQETVKDKEILPEKPEIKETELNDGQTETKNINTTKAPEETSNDDNPSRRKRNESVASVQDRSNRKSDLLALGKATSEQDMKPREDVATDEAGKMVVDDMELDSDPCQGDTKESGQNIPGKIQDVKGDVTGQSGMIKNGDQSPIDEQEAELQRSADIKESPKSAAVSEAESNQATNKIDKDNTSRTETVNEQPGEDISIDIQDKECKNARKETVMNNPTIPDDDENRITFKKDVASDSLSVEDNRTQEIDMVTEEDECLEESIIAEDKKCYDDSKHSEQNSGPTDCSNFATERIPKEREERCSTHDDAKGLEPNIPDVEEGKRGDSIETGTEYQGNCTKEIDVVIEDKCMEQQSDISEDKCYDDSKDSEQNGGLIYANNFTEEQCPNRNDAKGLEPNIPVNKTGNSSTDGQNLADIATNQLGRAKDDDLSVPESGKQPEVYKENIEINRGGSMETGADYEGNRPKEIDMVIEENKSLEQQSVIAEDKCYDASKDSEQNGGPTNANNFATERIPKESEEQCSTHDDAKGLEPNIPVNKTGNSSINVQSLADIATNQLGRTKDDDLSASQSSKHPEVYKENTDVVESKRDNSMETGADYEDNCPQEIGMVVVENKSLEQQSVIAEDNKKCYDDYSKDMEQDDGPTDASNFTTERIPKESEEPCSADDDAKGLEPNIPVNKTGNSSDVQSFTEIATNQLGRTKDNDLSAPQSAKHPEVYKENIDVEESKRDSSMEKSADYEGNCLKEINMVIEEKCLEKSVIAEDKCYDDSKDSEQNGGPTNANNFATERIPKEREEQCSHDDAKVLEPNIPVDKTGNSSNVQSLAEIATSQLGRAKDDDLSAPQSSKHPEVYKENTDVVESKRDDSMDMSADYEGNCPKEIGMVIEEECLEKSVIAEDEKCNDDDDSKDMEQNGGSTNANNFATERIPKECEEQRSTHDDAKELEPNIPVDKTGNSSINVQSLTDITTNQLGRTKDNDLSAPQSGKHLEVYKANTDVEESKRDCSMETGADYEGNRSKEIGIVIEENKRLEQQSVIAEDKKCNDDDDSKDRKHNDGPTDASNFTTERIPNESEEPCSHDDAKGLEPNISVDKTKNSSINIQSLADIATNQLGRAKDDDLSVPQSAKHPEVYKENTDVVESKKDDSIETGADYAVDNGEPGGENDESMEVDTVEEKEEFKESNQQKSGNDGSKSDDLLTGGSLEPSTESMECDAVENNEESTGANKENEARNESEKSKESDKHKESVGDIECKGMSGSIDKNTLNNDGETRSLETVEEMKNLTQDTKTVKSDKDCMDTGDATETDSKNTVKETGNASSVSSEKGDAIDSEGKGSDPVIDKEQCMDPEKVEMASANDGSGETDSENAKLSQDSSTKVEIFNNETNKIASETKEMVIGSVSAAESCQSNDANNGVKEITPDPKEEKDCNKNDCKSSDSLKEEETKSAVVKQANLQEGNSLNDEATVTSENEKINENASKCADKNADLPVEKNGKQFKNDDLKEPCFLPEKTSDWSKTLTDSKELKAERSIATDAVAKAERSMATDAVANDSEPDKTVEISKDEVKSDVSESLEKRNTSVPKEEGLLKEMAEDTTHNARE